MGRLCTPPPGGGLGVAGPVRTLQNANLRGLCLVKFGGFLLLSYHALKYGLIKKRLVKKVYRPKLWQVVDKFSSLVPHYFTSNPRIFLINCTNSNMIVQLAIPQASAN